jgi:hypothetical protein
MLRLSPEKLHVVFKDNVKAGGPIVPRCYTLTHSDFTGDLFLTIGTGYDLKQISGIYTKLLRDEVLAEWGNFNGVLSLIVHCHISGGLIFGKASWRESIFRQEMPLILESIRYGDRILFKSNPELDECPVWIHFKKSESTAGNTEKWGIIGDYK